LLTPRATRVSTSISRALSERSTGPRLRLTSLLATVGESTESPRAVRGLEELDPVGDHHRDPVAAAHTEVVQHVRHAAGPVVELGVRSGLAPQAERDLLRSEASVGNQAGIHP